MRLEGGNIKRTCQEASKFDALRHIHNTHIKAILR